MPIIAPVFSNVVVIFVMSAPVPTQIISDELREWGVDGWDWKIHQMSESEFAVTFPTKESLRMMASYSSFTLPLNQVVVSVQAANDGACLVASLSEVWVLVDGVPSGLRNSRFMMAFGELVGKPVEVDPVSLDNLGPVRMKIWCLEPQRVQGSVDIFPLHDAFCLRVRTEDQATSSFPSQVIQTRYFRGGRQHWCWQQR